MTRMLGRLVLFALAACRTTPTPITVRGDPASLSALAGNWEGEYWGGASNRRGVLTFSLATAADTAYGDVTMLTPLGQSVRPLDSGDQHRMRAGTAQA